MGSFFLYKTQTTINRSKVEALFIGKGFASPAEHVFGAWTLLHYRKQLLQDEPLAVSFAGESLFAVGTFAYKGHGLRKSLETVLADLQAGRLVENQLVGVYCLLYFKKDGLVAVTDRLNLFHVFTNEDNTVFSSSFSAVLKAGPGKFRLNFPAAIENMLTGYIIGPGTIVHGIYLVDAAYRRRMQCRDISFLPISRDDRLSDPLRAGSFDSCVEEEIEELDRYFGAFKALVDESGGVDIGLSGGYDSRVLVLMAKRHFTKVSAHSHFHRKVTTDETCAEKIAAALDVPLYRCADAKQPAEMDSDEFERNLDNTSAYNDGRVIHDYSWLVFFRTRWYREAVLKELRFGMNGLGGELYRNHDNHCYGKVDVREWVKARVLGVGITTSVGNKTLNETMDYLLAKAGATLGVDLSRQISHHQTRRYFGELFSVYGAAVRMNIDNQLAYSLSPFLDYGPRLASYRALPHIGLDGQFEAAMIRRLSPAVAAIPSTYGFAFNRRAPLSRLAKCAGRGLIPYGAQNVLGKLRRSPDSHSVSVYKSIYDRHPLVRRAVELMKSPEFGLIWDSAVGDYLMVMRALSVGIMVLKHEDCIDL